MTYVQTLGRAVDWVVWHLGPKACLKYMYTYNTHRLFGVLHICHALVLDLIVYDNDLSNPALHGVLRKDHKK